jgi:DNA repair protein RadD
VAELRPYQQRACAEVWRSWSYGYQRVCLIGPTGSGKSEMGADVARSETQRGGRVLAIAHTREIHRQLSQRFPSGTVVVMVQTLHRRGLAMLGDWKPTLVVWDEAHHLPAKSFSEVASWFDCHILGLTATPVPGMAEEWDDSVVAALPSELVRDGFLCPVTVLTHGAPDVSRVRIRGGEYSADELAAITNVSELRGDILARYIERRGSAIGFACNIAHSQALVADFRAAGIKAAHIDGQSKDRDELLADFAAKRLDVLWNCDLVGEGLDIPGCEGVIQGRPLHTPRAYLQQIGRCRRPGKPSCWVHDHGGNLERHGHPDLDRDYSLQPGKARRSRTAKGPSMQPSRRRLVVECEADAYVVA